MAHRSGTLTEESVHRYNSNDNLYCETEDDDESSEEDNRLHELRGCLNKWTNYLHGWQERYFVLKDGALMYYKSPREHSIDCRGALRLSNARITPHGIDDCRFDVMVNDSIWYLRTTSAGERAHWLINLENHQRAACGQPIGERGLRVRRNSLISIHSGTTSRSTASSSSLKRTQALRLKLSEMDTFKEILCKQVDSLQSYFDACSMLASETDIQVAADDACHTEVVDGFGTFEDPEEMPVEAAVEAEVGPNGEPLSNGPISATSSSYPPPPQQQQNRSLLNRFLPSMFTGGRAPPSSSSPPVNQVPEELRNGVFPETEDMKQARHMRMQEQRLRDLQALLKQHGAHAVDFKGTSCIFKATAAGILTNLGHCIDLMQQREEYWRRRLEKEVDRRCRAEDAYRQQLAATQAVQEKMRLLGGPDCEEGPNCAMLEEEFYDALDAQLDRMEEEEREARANALLAAAANDTRPSEPILSPEHPLYKEIETTIHEHLESADFNVERLMNDASLGWDLVVDEGEMKMFTRPIPDDASGDVIPVDPLKAVHTIRGVSGKEVCHYFYDTAYRLEWDHAAEKSPCVLEAPAEGTVVQQQVYRRVWPTMQREAVYWSQMCRRGDLWLVVNRSTDHLAPPLEEGRRVRLKLNVALICRTERLTEAELAAQAASQGEEEDEESEELAGERRGLRCRLQYTAQLHPGGWAPRSIIRSVQRREFPHFLRRFSAYVRSKTRTRPVDW